MNDKYKGNQSPMKQNKGIQQSKIKNKGNQGKSPSITGQEHGKEKRKHEDFEDFEDFLDYKDFAKATGWKNKNDGKESNKAVPGSNKKVPSAAAKYGSDAIKASGKQSTAAGADRRRGSTGKDGKAAVSGSRRVGEAKDIKKAMGNTKKTETWKDYKSSAGTDRRSAAGKDNMTTAQVDRSAGRVNDRRTSGNKRNFNQGKSLPSSADKKPSQKDTVQKGACPYRKECGGCNILSQSYEAHLNEKQKLVEGLLKKYCKVEPIMRMEQPEHYRHKVHAVFDHDRKGNPISGVYEVGTHRVIPVEQCLIHNEKADAIIKTIRGMLKSFKILTYDEDTGYGLLRHVLIRTGYHSKEIMVVLVLGSPILPSKNNFVKALRKEHPEITTVVVNVNDKKTSMVLGDKEQIIYGKGYIEDSLCGKTFRISPKSFYQVNPAQTEILYQKAIELAGLDGSQTVVDAYCGIGTIGLVASDHAKRVIGVELNKDAVKDAITNAKRNNDDHIEFYQNDAGVFLSQVAERGDQVDVVFMDPPRSGSTIQFMDAVATIKPKKVVYISCNPVTQERDLEYLTKRGYKAEIAVPVDMFPWTEHVETVVLMSRKDK